MKNILRLMALLASVLMVYGCETTITQVDNKSCSVDMSEVIQNEDMVFVIPSDQLSFTTSTSYHYHLSSCRGYHEHLSIPVTRKEAQDKYHATPCASCCPNDLQNRNTK